MRNNRALFNAGRRHAIKSVLDVIDQRIEAIDVMGMGETHTEAGLMNNEAPRKQVPVEIRVKTVVQVPADWDDAQTLFWLNESSHCIQTELGLLVERDPEGSCSICSGAEVVLLDSKDHEHLMEEYRKRPLGAPPIEDEFA